MSSICVFCGSSKGQNSTHMKLAHDLGALLAERGHKLIYGGGGLGLMALSLLLRIMQEEAFWVLCLIFSQI